MLENTKTYSNRYIQKNNPVGFINRILLSLVLVVILFSCINQVDNKKTNSITLNNIIEDNNQLQSSSEFLFKIKIDSITINNWDDLSNDLSSVKNITILHDTLTEIPIPLDSFPSLESFRLYACNYKELPQSIGKLELLRELFLDYTEIVSLPEEIGMLKSLEKIVINKHDCYGISSCEFEIGKWIENLHNLREITFVDCNIKNLPNGIKNLKNINQLIFKHSNFLEFPEQLLELDSLKHLVIINSKELEIPSKLKNKKNLFIGGTFK